MCELIGAAIQLAVAQLPSIPGDRYRIGCPRDLFFELGRRKVVAGQEDIIIEAAMNLADASRPIAASA